MSDRPARRLFDVPPSAYVEERTRLAKELRAAGDKETAKAVQALKRPTLAIWALVAAGDDPAAVRTLFAATSALGDAQAAGDRDATMTATKERKDAVGAVTAAAVDALRAHEPSAEARRPEIRTLVDQLSRHPELADAWIDGTLRDLPDEDAFGFAAFAEREVTAIVPRSTPGPRPNAPEPNAPEPNAPEPSAPGPSDEATDEPAARPTRTRALRSVPAAPTDERPARDPEQERAERAARAARAAERRDAIRARDRAASALVTAEKRLAGAQDLFERAEADLRSAEADHAAASSRHAAAVERVDRLADE